MSRFLSVKLLCPECETPVPRERCRPFNGRWIRLRCKSCRSESFWNGERVDWLGSSRVVGHLVFTDGHLFWEDLARVREIRWDEVHPHVDWRWLAAQAKGDFVFNFQVEKL